MVFCSVFAPITGTCFTFFPTVRRSRANSYVAGALKKSNVLFSSSCCILQCCQADELLFHFLLPQTPDPVAGPHATTAFHVPDYTIWAARSPVNAILDCSYRSALTFPSSQAVAVGSPIGLIRKAITSRMIPFCAGVGHQAQPLPKSATTKADSPRTMPVQYERMVQIQRQTGSG